MCLTTNATNSLARKLMKEMNRFLVLFFVAIILFAGCENSGNQKENVVTTTLFLVRHAEKADDGTKDPPLDSMGILRAAALQHLLQDVSFNAVYASPYKRTQQTVVAIAQKQALEVTEYDPGSKEFVAQLLEGSKGGNFLVSGHSNTVPGMVNQLLNEDKFGNLEDSEYDFLFIVTIGSDTTLQVLHYGVPSGSSN